ncbi:CRISPR-associated protein Cas1 [Francisella cf. novicida Fx1]|uniref:type V CRISPR-associated endonuclease Cas1 n=1 Tax=Francisella tularensis TaxID=263 RepID=UPI00020BD094|nr:type V CRISPR-associated endonuclease Cas1 [Francisella tularensis]AEE87815.1 CRISPR-associated protein Cas1 [Francisella cf. novicida Fx1]
MFSKNDIESKNIVFINIFDGVKLSLSLGNIVIKDKETDEVKTKLSVHKVLVLFIVGNMTMTSQLLETCKKNAIQLVFMKNSFRPYLCFGDIAEANFLARYKQYSVVEQDISLARIFITSKIRNQHNLVKSLRDKTPEQQEIVKKNKQLIAELENTTSLAELMGIEGNVAKNFFKGFYGHLDSWQGRKPRIKQDPYNVVLDLGYSMLFNFVECFLRLFGFDLYKGFCHQTWYKRKSLVCDFVEPFRCIVDNQVRKSWNLGQFSVEDFGCKNEQFYIKKDKTKDYSKILFAEIISYKLEIFEYVREFYRAFMRGKEIAEYPIFCYETRRVYVDSQL